MSKSKSKSLIYNLPPLYLFILVTALVIIFFAFPKTQTQVAEILGVKVGYVSGNAKLENTNGIETAKVTRVVDGDTIKLDNGDTVRYLNIDTPETKKPGTPVQCYGTEAYEANKSLVEGKQIWLVGDKENQDRYDRLLRFVFINQEDIVDLNKSVNASLVRSGLARTSIYKPNDTYEDLFRRLERQAIDSKIGIWSACENPFKE